MGFWKPELPKVKQYQEERQALQPPTMGLIEIADFTSQGWKDPAIVLPARDGTASVWSMAICSCCRNFRSSASRIGTSLPVVRQAGSSLIKNISYEPASGRLRGYARSATDAPMLERVLRGLFGADACSNRGTAVTIRRRPPNRFHQLSAAGGTWTAAAGTLAQRLDPCRFVSHPSGARQADSALFHQCPSNKTTGVEHLADVRGFGRDHGTRRRSDAIRGTRWRPRRWSARGFDARWYAAPEFQSPTARPTTNSCCAFMIT